MHEITAARLYLRPMAKDDFEAITPWLVAILESRGITKHNRAIKHRSRSKNVFAVGRKVTFTSPQGEVDFATLKPA